MSRENGSEQLTIGRNEYIKQFFVYDGSNRMIEVYEARNNARDGEPALKTTYEYDGVSTRVLKMLEEKSTWDAAWDI